MLTIYPLPLPHDRQRQFWWRSIETCIGERKSKNACMGASIDLLVVPTRRFIEANGSDIGLVGRPICPNINTMLSGFLQIEEHPAAEDAKESGTTQSIKYDGRDGFSGDHIVHYGKYRA